MKINRYFIFFIVFILLIGGTFVSVMKAQIQVHKLEKEAYDKSLMSFNLTRQKIESYLSNLQDKITIKSYQYQDELIKIFQNADDNDELLEEIQHKIKKELPNVNLTTLADENGEMIITDFDGYINDICQKNLVDFSKSNRFEIRIHPNSLQYHFDIMVRYKIPKKNISGIFFTSFVSDGLKEILKQGEIAQNKLFLMFNPIPDLIEVDSSGNRQQLNREIKLSASEINRISIRETINNTSWTLVNLPAEDLLVNEKMRIYVISFFETLFLYIISGILFYIIYKEIKKNKKISERYLLFLEKTDIAFLIVNNKGVLKFANAALKNISELKNIENMIGKHVLQWMNHEVWEKINGSIQEADKKAKVIALPIKLQRENGEVQLLLVDIFADYSEKQTLYAVYCKDVTKVNQIEKLKIERQAAILSEKASTEFLANISHELRTPMHGILSYAAIGIRRVNKAPLEQLEKYFTNINISGTRLLGLLNNLLDLSKLEAGQMPMDFMACDLKSIVKDSIMEQKSTIDELELQLLVNYDETIDTKAEMDAIHVSQVIANLLSNAIKFTREKGAIKISFFSDHLMLQDRKIAAISFSITNEGEGISKSDLTLIFAKFKQSSDLSAGTKMGSTGLGLSICKEIIQAHHGVISAQSELGKNTTLIMTIPKKQP